MVNGLILATTSASTHNNGLLPAPARSTVLYPARITSPTPSDFMSASAPLSVTSLHAISTCNTVSSPEAASCPLPRRSFQGLSPKSFQLLWLWRKICKISIVKDSVDTKRWLAGSERSYPPHARSKWCRRSSPHMLVHKSWHSELEIWRHSHPRSWKTMPVSESALLVSGRLWWARSWQLSEWSIELQGTDWSWNGPYRSPRRIGKPHWRLTLRYLPKIWSDHWGTHFRRIKYWHMSYSSKLYTARKCFQSRISWTAQGSPDCKVPPSSSDIFPPPKLSSPSRSPHCGSPHPHHCPFGPL